MNGPNGGEFLNLTEAAARVGIARQTLSASVRLGAIPAYRDPLDRRLLLLRRSDLDGLRTPRPVAVPRGEAVGVA